MARIGNYSPFLSESPITHLPEHTQVERMIKPMSTQTRCQAAQTVLTLHLQLLTPSTRADNSDNRVSVIFGVSGSRGSVGVSVSAYSVGPLFHSVGLQVRRLPTNLKLYFFESARSLSNFSYV